MRSTKPRSRSKSNRNRSVGNVVNRVFDSSGPEGKVRGTPQQIIEKYNQLARDAQLGNDRVAAENFQQHAEHYLRLLGEAQRDQDQRRDQQERENRERQSERDRERSNRDVARQTPEQQSFDPATAPQPDVFDMSEQSHDNGLVETPESSPQSNKHAIEPIVRDEPNQPVIRDAQNTGKLYTDVLATESQSTDGPATVGQTTDTQTTDTQTTDAPDKVIKSRAPRKPRKKPAPKAQSNSAATDEVAAESVRDLNPSQDTAASVE